MEKKVLLVLGASADMGISLIKKVLNNYDYVLAHYNKSESELNKLKSEAGEKLKTYKADFNNSAEVHELVERIKSDGFIPNHIVHLPADKYYIEKFNKTSWDKFQTGFDISLRSLVIILQGFLPLLAKKGRGKVVVMLSSYTNNTPPKYASAYGTVKYALLGLVKGLSAEYANKGININAVSPSMTETKFLSEIPELILQQNASVSPMGRNLSVSDITPTIEYLLSEGSDSVTGQNIFITGGQ